MHFANVSKYQKWYLKWNNKLILSIIFFASSALFSQEICKLYLTNSGTSEVSNEPITFGQVFKLGDVPENSGVVILDENNNEIPTQLDVKATWPDGSLRHGIISFKANTFNAKQNKTFIISKTSQTSTQASLNLSDLVGSDFSGKVSIYTGSATYTADLMEALQQPKTKKWLGGNILTSWITSVPFKDDQNSPHPHLSLRLELRAYEGLNHLRADISIENTWSFVPNPSGFVYDATLELNGEAVDEIQGIEHTHHSRWRKVYWLGDAPFVEYAHDNSYLIQTRSVPTYNLGISIDPNALSALETNFPPMSNGNLSDYFPETGANAGIGPLPNFSALYLTSKNTRALKSAFANGQAGGSYQIHYRDQNTDLPITIVDFPYMTLLGNPSDAINPKTGKSEAFPDEANGLEKYTPDQAHQPSIAYLPYLCSGDYFFLEELQFWANYNTIVSNPSYRGFDKGLLNHNQTRGQAWTMRTLANAAFITPDDHPLKDYFEKMLQNNIENYNNLYPQDPSANKLGVLTTSDPRPWMDDFFSWTVGYIFLMGYENIKPMALYKLAYPINRMIASNCWLQAPRYTDELKDGNGEYFASFEAYDDANVSAENCDGLEMNGYPESPTGYGANMQPALAVAVDLDVPGALEAWIKYETRNPKQDYSSEPQFSVVPFSRYTGTAIKPSDAQAGKLAPHSEFYFVGVGDNNIRFQLVQRDIVSIVLFDNMGRRLAAKNLSLPKGEFTHRLASLLPRHKYGTPYILKIRSTKNGNLQLYQ